LNPERLAAVGILAGGRRGPRLLGPAGGGRVGREGGRLGGAGGCGESTTCVAQKAGGKRFYSAESL